MSDEFQIIGRTELERPPKQKQIWQRPAHDVLKLNTDGAFSSNTGAGGWGYVIRNEDGMVINAGAGSCFFLLDAFHAEAVACLKGIQAAGELGISKIQVETYSLMLKVAMESNGFALAAAGGIVLEIKDMIRSLFTTSSVSFCPRVCNRVAHALAAQRSYQSSRLRLSMGRSAARRRGFCDQ
jgi:hypothetical protein